MSPPDASNPRFGRAWAKVEIFLGLTTVGLGLFAGQWLLTRPTTEIEWEWMPFALVLFVLGGYLTLAGHRSHIYRSNMELEARLKTIICPRTIEGEPR